MALFCVGVAGRSAVGRFARLAGDQRAVSGDLLFVVAVQVGGGADVGGQVEIDARWQEVRRRPVLAGEADERRHESVGVERAVHGRRQPDGRGPDAALGEGDQAVLGVDPWAAGQHVRLSAGPAQPGEREQQRPGGDDEGLAAAGKRSSDRLDSPQVCLDRAGEVTGLHRLVLERQVHDSISAERGVLQPSGIVEAPRGAPGPQRRPARPRRRPSGPTRRPRGQRPAAPGPGQTRCAQTLQ